MLTVKQLISKLKKMPQDLNIGVRMHDNNYDEVAGWVYSTDVIIEDIREYNGREKVDGNECVVLGC